MAEEKRPVARDKDMVPYRDPKSLTQFFNQPKKKIAESIVSLIAGAASMERAEAVLAAGRIVQGVIKGNAFEQIGIELETLIEKGKIPPDYAEKKYGFQSLGEILNFIDSEVPDSDRLRAVKAMFYALNATKINGEELLRYQLFRLSMKLSASQLMVLKFSYSLKDSLCVKPSEPIIGAYVWIKKIAELVGHGVTTLVTQDEDALIDLGLLTKRQYNDRSGIDSRNGRLSDLGLKFCEYLEEYSPEDA